MKAMMTKGCKIGKVKLKNSNCQLKVFPNDKSNVRVFRVGDWGEISFRMLNNTEIENETMIYMLRCAEQDMIHGRGEKKIDD